MENNAYSFTGIIIRVHIQNQEAVLSEKKIRVLAEKR
jgi:hypothetical protein